MASDLGAGAATGPARRGVALGFLAFFAIVLLVHVSVPWKVATAPSSPFGGAAGAAPGEVEVVWAHHYAEQPFLGDEIGFFTAVPDPTGMALAGAVVGLSISAAWLLVASLAPATTLTRTREAAVAATLAIPLFLVIVAGARGMTQGLQHAELQDDEGVWGWSPAGIALLSLGGLGAFALATVLLMRMPARRACVGLLFGSLAAAGALHGVPWLTVGSTDGTQPARHIYYDLGALAALDDALGLVAAAVLVTLLGAIAWTALAALVPPGGRAADLVDGAFAVAAVAPLVMGARAVGHVLGLSLATSLDTQDEWALSINGFVFATFVVALLLAMAVVAGSVARASAASEVEA